MGTCYNMIITWIQKISLNDTDYELQELSKTVRESFKDGWIGDVPVRDTKLGENFFMFMWCEHDNEDWALTLMNEELKMLQKKGLQFDSCCLDFPESNIVDEYTTPAPISEDIFRQMNKVSLDDFEGLKKLNLEFGYLPLNASDEINEKLNK
jgi:hypothetical protein